MQGTDEIQPAQFLSSSSGHDPTSQIWESHGKSTWMDATSGRAAPRHKLRRDHFRHGEYRAVAATNNPLQWQDSIREPRTTWGRGSFQALQRDDDIGNRRIGMRIDRRGFLRSFFGLPALPTVTSAVITAAIDPADGSIEYNTLEEQYRVAILSGPEPNLWDPRVSRLYGDVFYETATDSRTAATGAAADMAVPGL